MQLYKFSNFENAKSILENCALWSNSPLSFNDPFEMLPSLDEERKNIALRCNLQLAEALEVHDLYDPALYGNEENFPVESFVDFSAIFHDSFLSGACKDYSVVCFSEVVDPILLWSQYADSHQGIAIGFDLERGSFPQGRIKSGLKVNYLTDRSSLMLPIELYRHQELDWFDKSTWPTGYRKLADGTLVSHEEEKAVDQEALFKLLGHKYDAWSYEQERRFVYSDYEDADAFHLTSSKPSEEPRRAILFKPENVVEIIFGYRCTAAQIQSLEPVLKKLPHAKLRYVDFHPTLYKLRFHDADVEKIQAAHLDRLHSFRTPRQEYH